MKTKFTPGPWSSPENKSQYSNVRDLFNGNGQRFATIQFGSPSREVTEDEIEANARLIAAAPEMYEALENILRLSIFKAHGTAYDQEQVEKARAALAKASGGQP